jgi:hypothetical protein
MQSMDHSIADMFFKGYIDREEAILRSINPAKMDKQLTARGNANAAVAQK